MSKSLAVGFVSVALMGATVVDAGPLGSLVSGANGPDAAASVAPMSSSGTVAGVVFNDKNGDGERNSEPAEPGVAGVESRMSGFRRLVACGA